MAARSRPLGLPERYRFEGPIAAGGMAAVYAAHDEVLDRPVAVKVLAEHLNDDLTARQRFQREARAAAALSSHPGVVTIFDVGEHEDRSFLVMERRTGGTLGDVIARDGQPDRGRVLGWLNVIADAFDAAHERGVVHRDIKPGNLLLDERDRVAVADFGIATLAYETERFTQTGQVLGTAAYLSPEQAVGEPATAASDHYALAVVAYELLTGSRPFTAEHFAAQARAHIEDPPPPAPGLRPAAQAVLARGLAKAPEDRWPTARAFVDALERAVGTPPAETEATRAMPPLARTPAAAAVPPPPPRTPAAAGVTPPSAGTPAAARVPQPSARSAAAAPGAPRRPNRAGAAVAPAPPNAQRPSRTAAALAGLVFLVVVGVVAAAALSGGGGDKATTATKRPRATATSESRRRDRAGTTPTAAATTPTVPATATATPATPASGSGSASALNDQGFRLIKSDPATAVDVLQRAVAACGASSPIDPCAYATYNLGSALNAAGRPSEAIPVLQRELARWPSNQPGTVSAALAAACARAGQDCGGAGAGASPPGSSKAKKPKSEK